MWLVVSRELNFLIILVFFFYSTDSFELNKFNWNQQLTQIPQWIHLDSSMNSLEFINKYIKIHQQIHQQIHLNSSTNSLKFINEFIWFHPQIQLNLSTDLFKIFTNFPEILLIFIIWIFFRKSSMNSQMNS